MNINDLPVELLDKILEFSDLCCAILMRVCYLWNEIISSNHPWFAKWCYSHINTLSQLHWGLS